MFIVKIIIALLLLAFAVLLVIGAAYVAIVLYHQHRFDKIKDERYDFYMTRKETEDDYSDTTQG